MKQPLYNHDAERALIGHLWDTAALTGPRDALDAVESAGLAPEHFQLEAHQDVFRALLALLRKDQAPTHVLLADAMATSRTGQRPGLDLMLAGIAQAGGGVEGSRDSHVALVKSLALRRTIHSNALLTAARASNFNEQPEGVALEGSAVLASLAASGASDLLTMEHDVAELLEDVQARANGERPPALTTGIDVWDEVIGGLQSAVVTFVGAQPSCFKSGLVAAMVEGLATQGQKVGVFSLEDHPRWMAQRLMARRAGIPVRRIQGAKLFHDELQRVQAAADWAYGFAANVIRDGRSGLTGQQVAATARQMIVQRGCRAIFLDHVGELDVGDVGERHDLGVSAAVRALRDVAKDLNVPVVVLAHFRRPKSATDDEPRHMRPTSAMWANSAGIERMARVAVGLWMSKETPGYVTATVLKQTNGRRDFDFVMPVDEPSGMVSAKGGVVSSGEKGHSQPKGKPRDKQSDAEAFSRRFGGGQ